MRGSYPKLYAALKDMVTSTALEVPVARAIVRRSGARPGAGDGERGGVSVLSFSNALDSETGVYLHSGTRDLFTWSPMPDTFPWWPDKSSYGRYHTLTDLSECTLLRNAWFVLPSHAHPGVNIRVEGSLDGSTWEYVTEEGDDPFDWQIAGANVNGGQWRTYTGDGDPYETYPNTVESRVGVDNAFPGGLTSSGWHTIKEAFRAQDVHLRWLMEWSHLYDADPIYTSFDDFFFGYGDVQVS